ncbi:MAG: hypothetical protein ACE5I3_06115 [Phycisphaerae bacterium]
MAKRTSTWLSTGLLLACLVGCAQNAISGKAGKHEQIYHGTVGITGSDHEVVLLTGSEVPKLSIIGKNNQVIVEDGAVIRKVEIVGKNNEVTYPKGMELRYSEIGKNNQLIHRPER